MTSDPMARARWHMAAAKIERDVRLPDLTDAEIVMLIEAVCREAERERCIALVQSIIDKLPTETFTDRMQRSILMNARDNIRTSSEQP